MIRLISKKQENAQARLFSLALEKIEEISKAQLEAMERIDVRMAELNKSNKEFVEVIRHFFAVEHKMRQEDIQRQEEKARAMEPTPADFKY